MATADWVEREKIRALRPTKSQLKVGPLNFYPDSGTINKDGQPAIRDRGLRAFKSAVSTWLEQERKDYG